MNRGRKFLVPVWVRCGRFERSYVWRDPEIWEVEDDPKLFITDYG
jgi:hypothetical protein